MDRDVIKKIYIIQHTSGNFIKFSVFPDKNLGKRMAIGTAVFEENEARRIYLGLKAHFENTQFPEYVQAIDMRGMVRVNQEHRVRQEQANRSEPASAESIQRENLLAEGRLPQQTMGDVVEIRKKSEVN